MQLSFTLQEQAQLLMQLPSTPHENQSTSSSRIPGPRRPVFQLSGDDFSSAASNVSESESEYEPPENWLLASKHVQHKKKEPDYTDPDFERLPNRSWSLLYSYKGSETRRAVESLKRMIRRSREVLLETLPDISEKTADIIMQFAVQIGDGRRIMDEIREKEKGQRTQLGITSLRGVTHIYLPSRIDPLDFSILTRNLRNCAPHVEVIAFSNNGGVLCKLELHGWHWNECFLKPTALSIDKLDLNLIGIPDGVHRSNHITSLGLTNCELQLFPPKMCELENLVNLDLSMNMLSSLPTEIENLKSLKTLKVASNQLKVLPESIGNLYHLISLDLGGNELRLLPKNITKLKNLGKLILDDNELQSLPDLMGNISSLGMLSLQNNQLTSFPNSIWNCLKLTILKVRGSDLRCLPEALSSCIYLRELDLNSTGLTELPKGFVHLKSLWKLDLGNNELLLFPNEILGFENLSELYLQKNLLTELPSEIDRLRYLRVLDVGDNSLSTIPATLGAIGELDCLEYLYIDKNPIKSFPAEIHDLSYIQWKRVSLSSWENPFFEYPDKIGDLHHAKNGFYYKYSTDSSYRDVCQMSPIASTQRDCLIENAKTNT